MSNNKELQNEFKLLQEEAKKIEMDIQVQKLEKQMRKMLEDEIFGDIFNYDEYKNERKKYGDEAVKKYKEMKEMTMDEFMKSEFYRDLLKDK